MATTPDPEPRLQQPIHTTLMDPVEPKGRAWFLSSDELAATVAKIAKINARAARKGFTGHIEVHSEPDTRSYTPAPGALPVTVHGWAVSITGRPPSYAGWQFVAVVDTVGDARPAPVTRSFALDEPAYFYRVEPVIVGPDGEWRPVGPGELGVRERLRFDVCEVNPKGESNLVQDQPTWDDAKAHTDRLSTSFAATGTPLFPLPDLKPGVILRYPPGAEQTIDNDSIRPGVCDHCHTDRPRNTTVLVQHETTGELRQVGRSCLKDFLGWSTAPVFIDADTVRSEVEGSLGTRVSPEWDLESVLTYAWAVIETYGWVPASNAGSRPATRDLVADAIRGGRHGDIILTAIAPKLAEGQQMASRIVADLAPTLTDPTGYEANLAAILRTGRVNPAKHLGLAVSAVNAWHRLNEDVIAEEAKAGQRHELRHAGRVGERITLTGTVTIRMGVEGYRYDSPPQMLIVLDCGDAVAKMITTAAWAYDVKQGDQLTVTGTVKAHAEYKGIPQTVLLRPKKVDSPPPNLELSTASAWETVKPVEPRSRFQEAPLAPTAPLARGLNI